MSLINKVLINIDKHQEAAEQVKPQATYDGLSPVARSNYGIKIPFALGILVVAGGFLWTQYHKPSTKLPQPIAQAVLPLETKTTEASATKLTAPVDSAKVSATPVVTKPVTTPRAAEVASNDVVKAPKQDKPEKLPASKEATMKVWSPEQRTPNLHGSLLAGR